MSPKVLRALYYRGLEQEVQQPGDNSFFQQLVQNKLKLNQDILSAIQEKVITSGLTGPSFRSNRKNLHSVLFNQFRWLSAIAKMELIIINSLISYIIAKRNYLCRIGKVYISIRSFYIPVRRKTIQDSFHRLYFLSGYGLNPLGISSDRPCVRADRIENLFKFHVLYAIFSFGAFYFVELKWQKCCGQTRTME